MAKIGSLVADLRLESASFIRDIRRATQETARATNSMQKSMSALEQTAGRLGRSLVGFVSLRAIGEGVKQVAQYADAWKVAANQVAAASSIAERQGRSMEGINKIAAETRTSLETTAELYAKLLRSTADLAVSEGDVARATGLINKAFKAGGASTSEMVNGIRQIGQALASGILQGDELRSIRENAPLIAQAIADEFNTTIGGLKKLGAEGKLVSDRVFGAILEKSQPIEAAFAKTNATIAESFTVLNNAATQYIGQMDKASGASAALSAAIMDIAKNFDAWAESIFGVQQSIDGYKDVQRIIATISQLVKKVGDEFGLFDDESKKAADSLKEAGFWANSLQTIFQRLLHPTQVLTGWFRTMADALDRTAGNVELVGGKGGLVGRGAANMPPPLPLSSREGVGGFGATSADALKATQAVQAEIRDLERLRGAVFESAEAFTKLEDTIEAENAALKAGHGITTAAGEKFIALTVRAKELRRELDELKGTVETFPASGGRTGVGGVNMPGGPVSTFDASQGRSGMDRLPTTEMREYSRALELTVEQTQQLTVAATQGQAVFDKVSARIQATNEVMALKGATSTSTFTQGLIDLKTEAILSDESMSKVIATAEGFKVLDTAAEQQRSLQTALSQGSQEYRDMKIHIDAVNEAIAAGIPLGTEQAKKYIAAAEAAARLKEETERMAEASDQVAQTINSTMNSAISSVSSAFADAVVEGENFRDMLDSLLKDLAKLALNAAFQLFLKQMIGGVGTTSTPGTGLMGGIALHTGGIVGREGKHRSVPAIAFAGAPRFHGGMMPGEYPAILKKGEGVFTPEQMKAMGGGNGAINVSVVNRSDSGVSAEGKRNSQGDIDIEVFIDQTVSRKLLEPGSGSNRAMKQGFGMQPQGIRR